MEELTENIFFFPGSKARSLLGFLHSPVNSSARTGIVYCHPFAEEKNMSHAVAVHMSRELARCGFAVLRFDLSGCGDSQGELDEISVEDWLEDIKNALEYLKEETGVDQFGLWGLRSGAGLVLQHALRHHDVSFLILWQPVLDLKTHIHQFLRRKISARIAGTDDNLSSVSAVVEEIRQRGSATVIGYPVSRRLYESLISLPDKMPGVQQDSPIFILSISLLEKPAGSLQQLSGRPGTNGDMVQFRHVVAEPFWDRYWRWECPEAAAATLDWIRSVNH